MGCGGSKGDGDEGSSSDTPKKHSRRESNAKQPAKKGNKVVEELFQSTGEEREFKNEDVLIEQDATKAAAYYIKSGRVKLMLRGENGEQKHLATRGAGDVLGELSLLLGHPATVTAVADGAVNVIEVSHAALMEQLRSDPAKSGRLFKAMAVALAERISELSSKLRSNVVTSSGVPPKTQQLPAADIAKARGMFGLPADEKLVSFYQCSVRAEKNAIKEEHAHVGEMYIFDKHVCFDLKVFAFHKQLEIESREIQSLLKSDDKGSKTIELQLKGASYEVTIENGFEEACLLIEASRMQVGTTHSPSYPPSYPPISLAPLAPCGVGRARPL